ncbi:AB1gp47 domain protein, partial [Acinetobacter baumannii 1237893]
GLISGAEAMIAALDDQEVEYRWVDGSCNWRPFNDEDWSVEDLKSGTYSFRLKPQTIKLELELPKPFEPEEDCHVYILDDGKTDGYRRYFYEVHGDKGNEFIGIWKTEDEIKQVVEQLRKIRGTNS